MALDMANFTIEMARPDIIAHSVELERKKFADYLAVQAGNKKDPAHFIITGEICFRWTAAHPEMAFKTRECNRTNS